MAKLHILFSTQVQYLYIITICAYDNVTICYTYYNVTIYACYNILLLMMQFDTLQLQLGV